LSKGLILPSPGGKRGRTGFFDVKKPECLAQKGGCPPKKGEPTPKGRGEK
jgi:hypothetical protein